MSKPGVTLDLADSRNRAAARRDGPSTAQPVQPADQPAASIALLRLVRLLARQAAAEAFSATHAAEMAE